MQIAVAVVVHGSRVLVGRRAVDAVDAAGLDEFPGGKVEPGESPPTAAARECLEESGIAVRIDRLLDRSVGQSRGGPLEILFFAAIPLAAQPEPRPPFTWVPLTELPTLRFPPANGRVLADLAQGGS
ncbi:MAG: NUDIX domain-containing protein [Planctomycetaceae bacterium]